ncbi:MAG: N(4)-(beta-N-acetylglucosaminyl)-L-asparaginase [Candidatus Poribacteria bacterium]
MVIRINRREFLTNLTIGATTATALLGGEMATAEPNNRSAQNKSYPLFVSTWAFGKATNNAALGNYQRDKSLLDAVEAGIQVTEADVSNASVGIGGIPNADGIVQLDACIMNGPDHQVGSVAAIEGIAHPISVARRVMEKTPHVMLAGDGAQKFALDQGFQRTNLLTQARQEEWKNWQKKREKEAHSDAHDTITLLALDKNGDIAGGCSTSGWGYKLPGRVGDSPIIGGGLYVDNQVGAAGCTGKGENCMRYCSSFMVVEFMRSGLDPQSACIAAIKRIASTDPLGLNLEIYFIALDKRGNYGAAGAGKGFQYAVTTPEDSQVFQSEAVGGGTVGPEGGNR